nr:MAG TPA: hypothetical protein [Caudoviricetes sp.]
MPSDLRLGIDYLCFPSNCYTQSQCLMQTKDIPALSLLLSLFNDTKPAAYK